MSSPAFRDYRVGGPPFLAVAAADAVRTESVAWGVEQTLRTASARPARGLAPCRARVPRRCHTPSPCWARTERVIACRLPGTPHAEPEGGLTIDCDCCALRETDACDDCVVTLPPRAGARRRRGHRRRRGARHAHARAGRPRADAALQHAGGLTAAGLVTGRTASGEGPVKRHLLVTNDFPPKVGGIQNYLWELWQPARPRLLRRADRVVRRRAPPPSTPRRPSAASASSGCPGPSSSSRRPARARPVRTVRRGARGRLVLLDPALPLGLLGPRLDVPYGVILHGAEVTVPGRLPGSRAALWPACCAGRGSSCRPAATRPPRAAGPRRA